MGDTPSTFSKTTIEAICRLFSDLDVFGRNSHTYHLWLVSRKSYAPRRSARIATIAGVS